MKILVVGAGDVGTYLSQILSEEGHDVTVLEARESVAREVDENLNVRVIWDNGASAQVLQQAGAAEVDFLLALTSDDRTNLIACSLGKALGAKNTIARVHDQTYADNSIVNYQLHFGIDYLLNPEALSAAQLAKYIRNPGRVAVENFARGSIEVQQLTLSTKSKLQERSLRDIRLPEGTRIGLIQEGERLYVPGADTQLQAGQLLTLVGSPESISEVKEKIQPEAKSDSARVVLFGATETTVALIRLLKSSRFKVRVIESDARRCRQLAERFPQITVIRGSATSLRLMEEEQVGSADYFVACTKEDEENIMTCLQARQLGTAHVMLILNKTDYEEILDQMKETLGVEQAVAPRQVTVAEVMRYVSTSAVTQHAEFSDGAAKMLEVRVSPDSPVIGKEIRSIAFPAGALIVALQHKFNAKVPGPGDVILADDRLVIITHQDKEKEIIRMLT